MPGAVLESGDTEMNRLDAISTFVELMTKSQTHEKAFSEKQNRQKPILFMGKLRPSEVLLLH